MTIFNPLMRTSEQKAYCDMVDKHVMGRIDADISNGKVEHAVYLISKLFGMAEKHVRLYSDRLKHKVSPMDRDDDGNAIEFYGHPAVVSRMLPFLRTEGASLDIIVENGIKDFEQHSMIRLIKALKDDGALKAKVSLRKLSEDGKNLLHELGFENHFMVTDESAYRLELNERQQNYQAEANFSNENTAKQLIAVFDDLHMEYSDELSLI